jgi:hypothetical protein
MGEGTESIGDRALTAHFQLVHKQQEASSAEQARLSNRLQSQEQFRRDSVSFQSRIGEIVRVLEDHATRISTASETSRPFRRRRTCAPAHRPPRPSVCPRTWMWWRRRSPTLRAFRRRRGCAAHLIGRVRGAGCRRSRQGRCEIADRSRAHHRAGDRADRGRGRPDKSAGAERHH